MNSRGIDSERVLALRLKIGGSCGEGFEGVGSGGVGGRKLDGRNEE